MSICSDVFISRKEAKERVRKILLSDQEKLIDLAVKNMDDYELCSYLNEDGSLYYYNIDKSKK